MQDAIPPTRPPVTQFRPLHTLIELDETSSLAQLTWASSLGSQASENTVLQAFVRLVSLISIVDPGEPFCVQDSTRGGYIWARAGDNDRGDSHAFVRYGEYQGDIPTDFSIGPGKVCVSLSI